MGRVVTLRGGRRIGRGEPCFVVAELGQNHQGDAYVATRMLKAAHDAGVDAVKLCKRDLVGDMTARMRDEPYLGPHSFGPTYGRHREALELTPREYAHLKDRMRYNQWPEILFATVCDPRSADEIEAALDPPLYKIASRDLDNLPLLAHVARLGKPIVLSTGMMEDFGVLGEAIETIGRRHDDVIVLHCTSRYPTPPECVGFDRFEALRAFCGEDVPIGFSDHTIGATAAVAAVALGAVLIEKHVTLAREMRGRDHACSATPEELAELVRSVRHVQTMFGPTGQVVDRETVRRLGRSLVTRRPIPAGTILTEDVLCLKSPGDGLRWSERHQLLGRVAARDLPCDWTLTSEDVVQPTSSPARSVTPSPS